MTDRHLVHDYVDGRLDRAAREKFERQLARDPELAREVAAYREISATLRDAPTEELPPGFYTRARARFEQARRPGVRLWSWQAAGLAAAAMIALAIFIPALLDRRPEIVTETGGESTVAQLDKRAVEKEQDELRQQSPGRIQAPADAAEPPAAAPAPPVLEGSTGKDAEAFADADTGDFAPTPMAEAIVAPEAPARMSAEGVVAEMEEQQEVLDLVAYALPAPRRDVAARSRTKAKAGLAAEMDDAGAGSVPRTIRIEPRATPFRCGGITAVRTADGWQIRLAAPTAQEPAATHGCAVELPDDGLAYTILDPARNQ